LSASKRRRRSSLRNIQSFLLNVRPLSAVDVFIPIQISAESLKNILHLQLKNLIMGQKSAWTTGLSIKCSGIEQVVYLQLEPKQRVHSPLIAAGRFSSACRLELYETALTGSKQMGCLLYERRRMKNEHVERI